LRKTLKNRQIMGYVPKLSHFLLAIQPSSGVLGTCGWTGSGRFKADPTCAAQHMRVMMPWFGWFPEASIQDWIWMIHGSVLSA
jgi:hypothetical protein